MPKMSKPLENTVYHSLLRIGLCVFAVLLVFDSGIVSQNTKTLSRGAQEYVASAVGVTVGVEPNDVNILTKRITELQTELERKDREIAVNLNNNNSEVVGSIDTSTFVLSVILFILLFLIIMNYILDYLRFRGTMVEKRKIITS